MGADTLEELFDKALEVFRRFNKFGIKVNYDKVKWMSTKISFLGFEIENGKLCLREYIKKKMESIGPIECVHDLERVIGIIFYARKVVKGTEEVLASLRADLKRLKKGNVPSEWFDEANLHVEEALKDAFSRLVELTILGVEPESYVLECDWSEGHDGFMLFACLSDGTKALVDLGSRVNSFTMSSYLGELDAIVWACKKTKAY